MKYFIGLILLASIVCIIYGFNIMSTNEPLAHKYIGSGTVGIFLIAMPLFLVKESKGKKMKDYMLNEENIKKMQGKKPKKPENQ